MTKDNLERNLYMLNGPLAGKGYDWWWHSFTGRSKATGKERSFFIEYFCINPALGGCAPVFGENGARQPSYVMIKAGCWGDNARQLHRFFGINELDVAEDELRLVVGDCFLSEELIRGNVSLTKEEVEKHPEYMSDAGSMSWLLHVNKRLPFNVGYGASETFRKLNAFEMFWHVQGMKTQYEGTVFLDGEEYEVRPESSYGYADKNWGCDFTSPWVWLSSCNLKSLISGKKLHKSAFDIGGGRPKVAGVALDKKLLMCFSYEGTQFEFNFSKFWTNTRTRFKCYETDDKVIWRIKTENSFGAMEVEAYCRKKDMLLVNYESPDGYRRHNRLWNGGNGVARIKLYKQMNGKQHLIDHIEAANVGCEYGEYQ